MRSGFVYGVADGTAQEEQLASAWTSRDAVDDARLKAERAAFVKMLEQVTQVWNGILAQHASHVTRTQLTNG